MNYVLPFQNSREVATLVQRRARNVVDQVLQQVDMCQRQSLEQSGFLTWNSLEGTVWGVFENGRCDWLLVIEAQNERVVYYRHRGDLEHFELHEPGHGGASVAQKVEQIGLLIHSYDCQTSCHLKHVERKIRWWNLQRWVNEVKSQVRERGFFPSWLSRSRAA